MHILKRGEYSPWIATAMVAVVAFFSVVLGQAQAEQKGLSAQQLQEVWDRQEIEQLMYRHARSLDRMDAELMKSTYWEDAIEEHQDPIYPELFHYKGNAWAFVPDAMEGFKALKMTQHRISNVLIELDGDKATAETYVWAYHVHEENGVDKEGILGGRHHFLLEKRQGEWRIKHRSTLFDWNQNRDATAIWSENFAEKYQAKRDSTDDSYNYLKNRTHRKSVGSEALVFAVEFNIKPEHTEAFLASLTELIKNMSEEDTFLSTDFHRDANDPNRFFIYERWNEASMDDFVKNQLKGKSYRNAYEEQLPGWSSKPRKIIVLEPIGEWRR